MSTLFFVPIIAGDSLVFTEQFHVTYKGICCSDRRVFQNENVEASQNDMLECAIQFDSFLSTARTLLQESYSIAQELGRKLDMTAMPVFLMKTSSSFSPTFRNFAQFELHRQPLLNRRRLHPGSLGFSTDNIADRSRRRQRQCRQRRRH